MKIKLDPGEYMNNNEEYLNCECPICGKRFHLKPFAVKRFKTHYCSNNNYLNLSVVTPEEHRRLHCKLNPQLRDPNTGRFITDSVPDFIRVKRVTETARVPERKTIGAAGYDLFADIENPVYIIPGETVMISSGIAFEIPKDYFGAIYARSGLAVKQGIRPSTCVSVIDSDFRGAVGLPLYNDSDEVRIIHPGDRVAQIVFQKALIVEIELVDELEETERGSNGFGSTGK